MPTTLREWFLWRAILRHTELPQQSWRGLGQTLVHRKRLKLTGRRKAIQELTAAANTRRPITFKSTRLSSLPYIL